MHGCANVVGSNTYAFLTPTAIAIKFITAYSNTVLPLCNALCLLNRNKIFLSVIEPK